MAKPKHNYYAVVKGRQPGIYSHWSGPGGAHEQVQGFAAAKYRGFATLAQAQTWYGHSSAPPPLSLSSAAAERTDPTADTTAALAEGKAVIYTDGGCIGNPGPGGFGVVLQWGDHRKELTGGYQRTTNNRMELRACIEALRALKGKPSVVLYSDSQYVVRSINDGHAQRWRTNGWMRTKSQRAQNADLWALLLDLCSEHDVQFRWLRGHVGTIGNERCDVLSRLAASGKDLQVDEGFIEGDGALQGPNRVRILSRILPFVQDALQNQMHFLLKCPKTWPVSSRPGRSCPRLSEQAS